MGAVRISKERGRNDYQEEVEDTSGLSTYMKICNFGVC